MLGRNLARAVLKLPRRVGKHSREAASSAPPLEVFSWRRRHHLSGPLDYQASRPARFCLHCDFAPAPRNQAATTQRATSAGHLSKVSTVSKVSAVKTSKGI